MPECEFFDWCEEIYGEDLEVSKCHAHEQPGGCAKRDAYLRILNSPQFKKQYAKLSVVKKVLEEVEKEFKSSIRNPHSIYIEWTKEELAELDDILATVLHNHGLEEVE